MLELLDELLVRPKLELELDVRPKLLDDELLLVSPKLELELLVSPKLDDDELDDIPTLDELLLSSSPTATPTGNNRRDQARLP